MGRMRLAPTAMVAAFAAALGVSAAANAVSWEDIAKDHETTEDVLSYGLGLKAQRHSPAKQVNADNVGALVPAWSFSFGGEKQRGQQSQALVYDGVIYVTGSYSRFFALDARTGKRLWEYQHRLPDDIRPCCDVVNRGPAIYGDKVYFGTLDAAVVALNRKTGKVVWNKKFGDHKVGYTMTGAPFIVKDAETGKVMLVHGSSGDEFGVVAARVMPLFQHPLKGPGKAGGDHAGVDFIEFAVAPRHVHHVHRLSGGAGFGDHVDRIASNYDAVCQT